MQENEKADVQRDLPCCPLNPEMAAPTAGTLGDLLSFCVGSWVLPFFSPRSLGVSTTHYTRAASGILPSGGSGIMR